VSATVGHEAQHTAGAPPAAKVARPKLLLFLKAKSGPCERTRGHLAQVLQHRRNHQTFDLYTIDVDTRPDLATRFQVTDPPTLVVLDGAHRLRIEQPRGAREIARALQPWLR
jgi:Thioredoxin